MEKLNLEDVDQMSVGDLVNKINELIDEVDGLKRELMK